jgi:hypothetical protein
MSSQTKPGLVLCHGIHADGSCFNKVMPCVPGAGHEVISGQFGLDANGMTSPRRAPT